MEKNKGYRRLLFGSSYKSKPKTPDKDELTSIFKKVNNNPDNQLGRKELSKAFSDLGYPLPGFQARRAMEVASGNASGSIQLSGDEFNKLIDYVLQLGEKYK